MIDIREGEDLNAGLARAGPNAEVKVTGTFSGTMRPKSGQKITGPFTLKGGADAINLKTAQAVGVSITDFVIEGYSGRGVTPWIGTKISQFDISECANNGLGGSYDNAPNMGIVITDGKVHHCGSQAQVGNTSAGAKFTRTGPPGAKIGSSLVIRDVEFSDNLGTGLWFDISSAGELVADILCERNTHHGFRYEISAGPSRLRNATLRNNLQHGLFVTSSAYFTARDLTLGGNKSRGIFLIEEERAVKDFPAIGGTHEGYHFVDIRLIGYELNGDKAGGLTHPKVTAKPDG